MCSVNIFGERIWIISNEILFMERLVCRLKGKGSIERGDTDIG